MYNSDLKNNLPVLKWGKIQLGAFFTALCCALLFHILILFALKSTKFNFTMRVNPLIENQTSPINKRVPPLSIQKEMDLQKQLAEVLNQINFNQTLKEKYEEENIEHIPQLSNNIDRFESTLPIIEKPSEAYQENLVTNNSLSPQFIAVSPSTGDETQSSKFLRRPTELEILFPNDQYLVDELIMATEMAQGRLAPEEIEDIEVSNSIKAGVEDASLLGSSMKNRSGILDTNLATLNTGSGGSFNLSSELGNWNYTALKSTSNFESRSALIPQSNKNELRGFDSKTLGSIAGSDDFNINIEYASRNAGGYVFKLELTPKKQIKFKHIKQNYFFLVDRSHSIRYNRYEMTKVALSKALALLQPGDTFNVLIFDDKINRLSDENMPWNAFNVNKARDFISQQVYGGLFANTDLYSSLGVIVPSAVAENEVNTAILLSDGDTFLSLEKQRSCIGSWTEKNAGKVSLYALASGKGNNLALLDILSVFNKGSLHYSLKDQGIENVLFSLMQSIRNPIGKDMSVTTLPSNPASRITIYPSARFLANLYENTPYVVYGIINHLDDFHIFFQGKYYDKLLDIKQEVSFKKATKIDAEGLEKKIAMQEAYKLYHHYLLDGQASHLNEVKQLLNPYRIPIAFK